MIQPLLPSPNLSAKIMSMSNAIATIETPSEVLETLHSISASECGLNVLGALLLPVRWGDLSGLEVGKTVFLHRSAPKGWWDEQLALAHRHPGPGLMLAYLSLAPFTMSENMRMLEPVGADRWSFELSLKYGMRDRLNCPIGGRWVVMYWSSKVLNLTNGVRALLSLASSLAAEQLQATSPAVAQRIGNGSMLTPRELAVLRLVSIGKPLRECSSLLGLGLETVRSHLKKAESKLGVHDRAHAVAQAIRQNLIS